MNREKAGDGEEVSIGPAPESRGRSKRQFKAMVIGGAILIITGIALAVYMAAYEEEPFIIALSPAFIGAMIIIAALFGKTR